MNIDGTIENIISVKYMIDQAYFKEYISTYARNEGLNYSQVISMVILSVEGPCPMSKVSERISLEKSSFTTVCQGLIQRGYVSKERYEADRRVFHIQLTNQGVDYARNFKKAHKKYIESILNALTDKEKKAYFAAIDTVLQMTEKIVGGK